MTRIKLPALTATLAVTAFLTLGACSASPASTPAPHEATPAASASGSFPASTPAPVVTPDTPATPAIAAGAAITDDATAAAAAAAGLSVYSMADGTKVAVDPAVALPAAVKADIVAPVAAAVASEAKPTVNPTQMVEAIRSDVAASGRKVIVLTKTWGSRDGVAYKWVYFAVSPSASGFGPDTVSFSADETLSKAQAFVAAQPDSASWDIIVATGD